MTFEKKFESKSNLDLKFCHVTFLYVTLSLTNFQNCKFPVLFHTKQKYKIPYIGPRFQSIIMKIGTNGEYLFQNTEIAKLL